MKLSLKDNQVVLLTASVLALYDFFTIPLYSFIITSIFAAVIYNLTKSTFLIAFVYFIPQIVRITNILLGNTESFTSSQNDITNRIKHMSSKHSASLGPNLNPETPTVEYFNDAKEVAKRNEELRNKNALPQVKEVSGIIDTTMPSGIYPIEGTPSYPNFMKESFIGAPSTTNTRIQTVPEEEVPAVGTFKNSLKPTAAVEGFDDESVNTALQRNANSSALRSSNIKSV
jgi:hypothetical protein